MNDPGVLAREDPGELTREFPGELTLEDRWRPADGSDVRLILISRR
jgi:hypothetical protein